MTVLASDPRGAMRAQDTGTLLVEAVRDARQEATDFPVDDSLPELARFHRVAPAVYRLLHDAGDQNRAALAALKIDAAAQALVHLRMAADLKWLGALLRSLDVPWALVKGPVLDALWPDRLMRQFHDVDVLVPPMAFADVLATLEAAGASLIDRNWPLLARRRYSEVSLRLPHGSTLDLHWDVVWDAAKRARVRFPTEAILARGRDVHVGGTVVPTFDPADTLLHVAHHAVSSGAHRLVWMKDIEVCAAAVGADWPTVISRADDLGLRLVLETALARVQRVLPWLVLPDGVLARRRGMWERVTALTDARFGAPILDVTARTGRRIYSSTGRTTAGSLWASTCSVAELVRPRSASLGRDDSEELRLDRPDPDARGRYLAYVAGHAAS